jgi:hypothetical protein
MFKIQKWKVTSYVTKYQFSDVTDNILRFYVIKSNAIGSAWI